MQIPTGKKQSLNKNLMKILSFLLKLIIAVIFIQSLFYKFSGHEQAIHIFSTLGIDPWGRIGIGVAELIVALLLFVPKTSVLAVIGSAGLMAGAILSHLTTPLGVVVEWNGNSDNGTLFGMAIAVLFCSFVLLILQFQKKPQSIKEFLGIA